MSALLCRRASQRLTGACFALLPVNTHKSSTEVSTPACRALRAGVASPEESFHERNIARWPWIGLHCLRKWVTRPFKL
jgi:hypothetical protein